jgi:hypothetical protein
MTCRGFSPGQMLPLALLLCAVVAAEVSGGWRRLGRVRGGDGEVTGTDGQVGEHGRHDPRLGVVLFALACTPCKFGGGNDFRHELRIISPPPPPATGPPLTHR